MDLVIDLAMKVNQNLSLPNCQDLDVREREDLRFSRNLFKVIYSTDRNTLNPALRVFWICLLCSLFATACTQAEAHLAGGFSEVKPDEKTQTVANFASGEISKILNGSRVLNSLNPI
jgi:hypothetical protein